MFFLATLLFSVVLANEETPRFIERYCENSRKQEIIDCVHESAPRVLDFYHHCISAATTVKTTEEWNRFLCTLADRGEIQFLNSCTYGALWVNDKRGNNFTEITDGCITKYEDKPSGTKVVTYVPPCMQP